MKLNDMIRLTKGKNRNKNIDLKTKSETNIPSLSHSTKQHGTKVNIQH